MRFWFTVPLWLCLSLVPSGLPARELAPETFKTGPSGAAYLDSVRYRAVETEVQFYDPTGGLPSLETREDLPGSTQTVDLRFVSALVTTAILAGLAVLVWIASGSFSLSLQQDTQNATRRPLDRSARTVRDGIPADLRTILAMADRQRALVLLAQAALARTIAANGVLLQPSWTIRDMLSHIPTGQAHFDALRSLAMAGEGVLFGDCGVSEAEFQARVASIRPLLAEAVT
jgi:hypothetical protein